MGAGGCGVDRPCTLPVARAFGGTTLSPKNASWWTHARCPAALCFHVPHCTKGVLAWLQRKSRRWPHRRSVKAVAAGRECSLFGAGPGGM